MPRTISTDLQEALDGEVVALALCYRIERVDGEVFRFTSTNSPLVVDAETFEPLDAVSPTAIESAAGSGVDNLEIVGLLSSERITETDLRAGRFDRALVEVFVVNPEELSAGRVKLGRFRLGNVTISDGKFTGELRSLSQRLTLATTPLVSPTCRVRRLGDAECTVDLSSLVDAGVVDSAVDPFGIVTATAAVIARAAAWYRYGEITFTTGPNAGLSREVKESFADGPTTTLQLQETFPFEVSPGDEFEVVVGCDRSFAQCVSRFENAANFRGEPHVPGVDKLGKRGRGGG